MEYVNSLINFYQWALTIADQRVANWPLMPSPIPTILIVAFYFVFIFILGPKFMNRR